MTASKNTVVVKSHSSSLKFGSGSIFGGQPVRNAVTPTTGTGCGSCAGVTYNCISAGKGCDASGCGAATKVKINKNF